MAENEDPTLIYILLVVGGLVVIYGVDPFLEWVNSVVAGISQWLSSADPVAILLVAIIVIFFVRALNTDVT